ncbi:cell differentiation protein RCD1 [Cryptosporidium ubiquitum]|uniref:Cell differentiation protein RCD1 n=1 Tax=Cryptosporidium ubiquitum TaxID=857276 RepID=A0A1J4MF19_9CRYT|nr:cell differentiation protein RCD1 [Cryptosporidium ubiquitum]OII72801.1 cell differentiation protein RCD1 [Cryptosporidium ubiquitum]
MLPQGGLNSSGCGTVSSSSASTVPLATSSSSSSSSSSSLPLHSSSVPASGSSSISASSSNSALSNSAPASGSISNPLSAPISSSIGGAKVQQRISQGELGISGVPSQIPVSGELGIPSSLSDNGIETKGNENIVQKEREKVYQYLVDMTCSSKREMALSKLSKYRETFPDLAPLLWHSFGCITALLQEIIFIYPLLSPPNLSNQASNRTCNCLALLQCVASHSETRSHFLAAHIPLYLYPFLNTVTKSRPFEYLRLTSLGVIGALVKVDDPEVVSFLLQTEIIPLCLRVMETGSELSKTVATFIIQKILLDDLGLTYICATPERFFTVCQVLGNVITQHNEAPSPRLLKHIIRCYLRLSENSKVRDALKQTIPSIILSPSFKMIFHDDAVTTKWLHQLYTNIC